MAFKGQVVLITGAGSGIGAAIAEKFSGLGAQLALVDISRSGLERTLGRCDQPHLTIVADLTDPDQLRCVVPTTIKHFGRLDVLVNNAGAVTTETIAGEDIAVNYDAVMAINLKAPIVLTSQATPHLIESRGNVVNLCCLSSQVPVSHIPIYCTSKAGLEMFTKCTALELASDGVRANCVLPWAVRTDMLKHMLEQATDEVRERVARAVNIEPEEVASLVVYLATEECARSITGGSYVIDRGHSIARGTAPWQ